MAPAICATGIEYFDTPALAIMALDEASENYRLVPTVTATAGGEATLPELSNWITAQHPRFAIVHADPRGAGILSLVPRGSA